MYRLADYDYSLPEALVAQRPLSRRDSSRLLCLERGSGRISHKRFGHIIDCLQPGDLLVLNNTKVVPARLYGRKESGGKVEILVLDYARGIQSGVFECLVKASKRPKPGSRLIFDGQMSAKVAAVNGATCKLDFSDCDDLHHLFDSVGHMPLPPYIRRQDDKLDQTRYQTVYADSKGAVAAPTAGLHFTDDLLNVLLDKGVRTAFLTLHVGYGTFVPVRVDDIRTHSMHSEWFELNAATADRVNRTKAEKGRVVAVGTTCVRTLEFCADANGMVSPQAGPCDLFIYPGYEFKAVDAMITNFHLPQSTLLMLVSAFAGREHILTAYAEAVRQGYRFFSYGDAMLIGEFI